MRKAAVFVLLAVLAIPLAGWLGAGNLDCDDCGDLSCAGDCCACPCCPIQVAANSEPVLAPRLPVAAAPPCTAAAPCSAGPAGVFHVPKPA
ncbi:MAG TPA: hypothetical protein VF121_09785 [Thermoanaerobaculia bacterium]|nr:hypothetical protein [Thermoanaerobaculia bacterium]